VRLQRRPPGVKLKAGETNFMERNRQRLEQMAQKSRERKDITAARSNSGIRNASRDRSGSTKPRVPLYQRATAPRQENSGVRNDNPY
jgi:hypothetical protein